MFAGVLGTLVLLAPAPEQVLEDPEVARLLAPYLPHIDKGLQWLARQQQQDGSWEAQGGQYPIAMTALAGMALLAEGSTRREGKYAARIDKAASHLLDRMQENGLIGDPRNPREAGRYMFGHGYALLFRTQVHAREKDRIRKREMEPALERAIDFLAQSQTTLGGWGYVAAAAGGDFDEGAATLVQLHALYAARKAGIQVPKEIIDKAQAYLIKSTRTVEKNEDKSRVEAGVIYSLKSAGGSTPRPPLTAAAIACFCSAGEDQSELALQWLNYCQKQFSGENLLPAHTNYGEFTHFYYAQVLYKLGEDRHAKLRPDLAALERQDNKKQALLKWSRYREPVFNYLCKQQNADGSWAPGYIGSVYTTSIYLTILQLDKGHLPVCRR